MEIVENILGYPITVNSKEECISRIVQWINSYEKCKYFACINPHSLEIARKDRIFKNALMNADLLLPDGIGIVFASRILDGRIRSRITGSDIFEGLNQHMNHKGWYSCFFLGSKEETILKVTERMQRKYPNIKVVGAYSPPFKSKFSDRDNELMVEAVNRVKPDVLWVGMTAPKQEKWIYENKEFLDVKFIGAIGAVFDFFSDTVKRPHPIFQELGFEWFLRFLHEPKRLWKRNLVSNPTFLLRVISIRLFYKI